MQTITEALAVFPKLSMDHVNALIALGALALAAFAIYGILSVVKELKRR